MPITVHWYDESQRAILYHVSGQWSWEDVSAAIDQAMTLLNSVNHKVHLLVDVRESDAVPLLNPAGLHRAAHAPTMDHPNTDLVILIGPGPLVAILYEIFQRVYRRIARRYQIVASMEEAEALMAAR